MNTFPDHLHESGIYSVLANQYGRGDFVLAKIVHLGADQVHVVIYPPSYKSRPTPAEIGPGPLELATGINDARERHVAMTRKLFALIRPSYVRDEPLSDNDLAGFRRWTLLEEKELLEAPPYIKTEPNKGVYKRIFLFCGLPFGLLQGIYQGICHGWKIGFFAFVIGFILFGGAMAGMQFFAVRKRGGSKNEPSDQDLDGDFDDDDVNGGGFDSASAFQVTELVVDKNYADTFALCREAIRTVKNCRVYEENLEGGTIEGTVNFSLTSEGESITLSVYMVDPEKTGVVVASMPRAGGDVDLGKNFDNVERIVGHIKTACK